MLSLKILENIIEKKAPGQLVIQLTDRCNACCPQCGMRVTEKFPRSSLSPDEVRKIIDAAAEKGFRALSFTGGEPMLMADELAGLIRHAGAAGIPFIRTGTNGFFFSGSHEKGFEKKISRIAENLADTPLRNFWISLDSALPEVHERMRGFPGLVSGMEKALPIFHDHGIRPSVNLGINRNISEKTMGCLPRDDVAFDHFLSDFYENFREAFRSFYRFVIDLGFTIVNSCYPMSYSEADRSEAVYAAGSDNIVVKFLPVEKKLLFQALYDTIPEFRSQIRIFSPRTSLYALIQQYGNSSEKHSPERVPASAPYPCRGGTDFFYISAKDGNTYPCGYRGNENLGNFCDLTLNGQGPDCLRCDWECFRDPSELLGPLLHGLSNPLGLLRKIRHDPDYLRLWFEDMRYYLACDFFDGRKAPDYRRMAGF